MATKKSVTACSLDKAKNVVGCKSFGNNFWNRLTSKIHHLLASYYEKLTSLHKSHLKRTFVRFVSVFCAVTITIWFMIYVVNFLVICSKIKYCFQIIFHKNAERYEGGIEIIIYFLAFPDLFLLHFIPPMFPLPMVSCHSPSCRHIILLLQLAAEISLIYVSTVLTFHIFS